MKPLFLLLLAANLGLFIWGYQREQTAERTKPRVRADIGNLQLLTEQESTPEAEPILEPTPTPKPAHSMKQDAEDLMDLMMVAASEPESTAIMPQPAGEEPQTPERDEVDEDMQITQQEADESSKNSTPEPLAENTEVVDVEPQIDESQPEELLAEQEQTAESEQEPQVETIIEPEPLTPELICYQLGPIVEEASAEGLSNHLAQLGLDTITRKKSIKKQKGYWVMYPPEESYAKARLKLKALKKVGISDLWLLPGGEHKNAISLGLFSRFINAEAVQKRVQKKGVTTEVLPHHIKVERYWLEFQSAEQSSIAKEPTLALQEAYPEEKFAIQPCSTVVTK